MKQYLFMSQNKLSITRTKAFYDVDNNLFSVDNKYDTVNLRLKKPCPNSEQKKKNEATIRGLLKNKQIQLGGRRSEITVKDQAGYSTFVNATISL